MSTLEVVREMLCQTPDAAPGDVLQSAQDELKRLSHLVHHAKNVLQRNGARKKLAELEPLVPTMEIEVGLAQLEKEIAEGKTGAQRAAARVHAQKLTSQISGLPASDEKEYFQQWLADLTPSLASTQPGAAALISATTSPDVAVALSPPTRPASPSPAAGPPLTPPPPDPFAVFEAELNLLEKRAKEQPMAQATVLLRDAEALHHRVLNLANGTPRENLQTRIDVLVTELGFTGNFQELQDGVNALEKNVQKADPDLAASSAQLEQISGRLARLGTRPELGPLFQKLQLLRDALSARGESVEIERALQRWNVRIQENLADDTIDPSLLALAERIGRQSDPTARATFSQRVELLRQTVTQRRQEEKISASLEVIRRESRGQEPSLSSLRAQLQKTTTEIQALRPGRVQNDFEKALQEAREFVTVREQKAARKPLQTAVVLQLVPLKTDGAPPARPIVFVSRERFSIGRKPENEPPRADLLTPSAELRISRIHATLFVRQRQIQVLAGDEGKPSTNPAALDETPLSTTAVPMSLETEHLIDLTGVFTIRVKHLTSAAPYGPSLHRDQLNVSDDNATVLVPALSGAIRLGPQGEDRFPVAAVWLFTDATIGASPNCAVTLAQPSVAPEQLRIHFWKKSFWVEALRSSSVVQLAGKSLEPGAAQPLFGGQELRLGNVVYKVELS